MDSLTVEQTTYTFYFPFNYQQSKFNALTNMLKQIRFHFFQLQSSDDLQQFFYPFIEHKLFPLTPRRDCVNRFTKSINEPIQFSTPHESFEVYVQKLNVVLFPFGIGTVTIQVEMQQAMELTSILYFAQQFRQIADEQCVVEWRGEPFSSRKIWIERVLIPSLADYYAPVETEGALLTTMPYFEDARMFVTGLLQASETPTDEQLFRLVHMEGRKENGEPLLSANNADYIAKDVRHHLYERFTPQHYTLTSYQGHIHVTTDKSFWQKSYETTDFYTVLMNYFYKIMLLKLTYEHSELSWRNDKEVVDELIEEITNFSARYYFDEIAVHSIGREIHHMLQKHFRIEQQYYEIKHTLQELYRIEEDRAQDRQNGLLFLLTIFSMISGIYGMNLVIEDWKERFSWLDMRHYNFWEWLALIVAVFGLTLAVVLVARQAFTTLQSIIKKQKRKKLQ